MSGAVVTRVEPVAHVRALVVEQTICTVAAVVDSGLAGLDKLPALAVYVVWQDALLMVPDGVVEEVAVLAEGGSGHVVDADVVEVALLRVGKQPVLLRADKVVHRTVEVEVFVSLAPCSPGC